MEANELMVGDWVKIPNTKVKHEFWRIGLDLMQGIEDGIIEPEPVPLTPEILEKNGFVKHETWDEWEHYTDRIFIDFTLLVDEDGFHLDIPNARIKYVHELQHALRLCGIEKEIEL